MLTFESDYMMGACPEVLKGLSEGMTGQYPGYGRDEVSARAKEKIRRAAGCENADIYFIAGGTQTNAMVISACLKEYEGVVSAVTGHINAHEAGAVEYTGHKVLPLPQHLGKIDPGELKELLEAFYADDNHEHMVYPGMVYISHPTEYGTLYSLEELKKLHEICAFYDIPLFLDGARLGYGLMSHATDVTLKDIAEYTDVFYIGGTKVGALFGEAVVFPRDNAPKGFYTMTKQHGAMLAKGFVLGQQFDTLFTDGLYFRISAHAIEMAEKLKKILKEEGIMLFIDSPTNQQFACLEDPFLEKLSKKVRTSFWEKPDKAHTVVRFATSWYTTEAELSELSGILKALREM